MTSRQPSDIMRRSRAYSTDGTRDYNENDRRLQCGIGPCRPRWMRKLAEIRIFVLSFSFGAMFSNALYIYMISQVSLFEKLLGLSSKQSGFLLSAKDVGYLVVIVFASHFTRNANKPLILGVLIMAFGLMAIICAVPHFIIISYPGLFYFTPDQEALSRGANSNSSDAPLCNASLTTETTTSQDKDDDTRNFVRRISFAILAISLVIQGALKAPNYPLSLTFIDDHVPKVKVGIYAGITSAIIIVGLAVATGLGAIFSQIYVTLEDVGLSKRDNRWVGAWWLGFIVVGVGACVIACPLALFPKYLKTNRIFKKDVKDLSDSKRSESHDADPPRTDDLGDEVKTARHNKRRESLVVIEARDFPKAMLRIAKNPMFICILAGQGLGTMGIVGRIVYFPKYLQVHFSLLPHEAMIWFGATVLLGAALGSVFSGAIMSCFKMSPKTCLIFVIIVGFITNLFSFINLALDCPPVDYEGFDMTRLINRSRGDQVIALNISNASTTCAHACACQDRFLPICGDDGKNYFSPCHAGCREARDLSTSFADCGCMPAASNGTAVSGNCPNECRNLTPFLICSFVILFLGLITMTQKVVVNIRCVSESDRTLALGINAFISTLIGTFLSPILYGSIIDTACLMWISGSCRIYDIAAFRNRIQYVSGGASLGSDALNAVSLLIALCSKRYSEFFDDETETNIGIKGTKIEMKRASRDVTTHGKNNSRDRSPYAEENSRDVAAHVEDKPRERRLTINLEGTPF